MSLIDDAMKPCRMMDKVSVSDGQFGFTTAYVEGALFQAAIVIDSSIGAQIAGAQTSKDVYTVTVDKPIELDFHDVFRRESDGQVFRVTSHIKDKQTPERATFQIGQVSAERWELPT